MAVTSPQAELTIYVADPDRLSLRAAWSRMVRELSGCRELVWQLLWRDFVVRYRQSVLGYVWALVPPVATVVIFSYLNRSRILSVGDLPLPYPVYVLSGLIVWQFFAGCVTAAAGSLVNGDTLVTKISFPREALVLASLGPTLFELPIRLGLIALVMFWYRVTPPATILLAPLVLVPLLLLSLGIGFVVAIANSLLRDLQHSLPFVLLLAMFLTPVVYPPLESWPWSLLNDLNPVAVLIEAARDWSTHGSLGRPGVVAAACIVSVLVFAIGWRTFHIAESYIVERI